MELKDKAASLFLHKKSFEDTEIADWKKIAEEYPAFGAAQLFYSLKLKEKNDAGSAEQLLKTALRFSNIFWLNFLLSNIGEIPDQKESTETPEPKETAKNDFSANNENTVENKLASLLQSQAADFAKPVDAKAQLPIETEPLYKTDYFASQGILTPKSQDAFEKKVKKFTDWLKDIKKTSPGTPQLNTTEEEEKIAAAQANASLKIEAVLTEPMAEVLALQGKKPQAIELYKKLSLLYPEKSAYFAAKINSLQ